MITFFCIFYLIFSEFFMLGYADFSLLNGFWETVIAIILLIILAPIMFPHNLGAYIYKNT